MIVAESNCKSFQKYRIVAIRDQSDILQQGSSAAKDVDASLFPKPDVALPQKLLAKCSNALLNDELAKGNSAFLESIFEIMKLQLIFWLMDNR